jgi:RNA polymerase sigma factor (sigma-70 family)
MRAVGTVDTDAEIYASHRDELVRYAAALVGRDEAPDVLSAVMVKVLSRRSLAELEEPRSYLYRSVLNESRSVLRRRPRSEAAFDLSTLPTNPRPPAHPEVVRALGSLPARQRAAMFLVYWLECTVPEAAQLMHARPGTLYRYLHLARNSLRKVLDETAL